MKKKNIQVVFSDSKLVLQLYVSGMSPKSMEAIENINKICSELLEDSFQLEIIDLYKHPEHPNSRSYLALLLSNAIRSRRKYWSALFLIPRK